MKENKRTIIIIIITIAVLLVAILGATYAYFASSTDADAIINAGVATAKSSAFSSSVSGNIEFNVAFNEMSEAGVKNEYIKTDNATLSVDLASEDDRSLTICNYDIVWVWDSIDRYTQSDVTLPYTHDGIEYPYEFSVQVGTDVEKDLSSLDWNEEGTAIISSKTIEVTQKGTKHEDYDVVVRMYNIPVNQEKLFNKSFKAHIKVENLNCISVTDTKLSYYVISGGTETKVDTVPKGDYKLNTERTTCKRGGTVSGYNSITGELTSTIPIGDECDIYFDELPKIIASGTDVASNYDGANKQISVSVSDVTDYQVYYSLDKALTRENYTEGSQTHPEVKEIGTTKVYWCAVKEGYATYCSSNDIVIGDGIITGTVSDYTGTYDGNSHTLAISDFKPSNVTMYYSTSTPLTKDNYSTEGKIQPEERTNVGTTIVYWCATAANYTPLCGSNKITINNASMSASGTDYSGDYDGNNHSITVNVTKPSTGSKIYYSTTTQLNSSNYTSGTTTKPTRNAMGTTTVYWCAVASNYTPVCSSNSIYITKQLAAYIKEDVYTGSNPNGTSGLYYHNASLANGAADDTYRYAGADEDVNNYVCFLGNDCTNANNLYRIISVDSDNQTKVIKATSLGNMKWNEKTGYTAKDGDEGLTAGTTYTNLWAYPKGEGTYYTLSLNDYLNGTYLTELQTKTNKIVKTTWHVGGYTYSQGTKSTPQTIYDIEKADTTIYLAKIGLMYASEYGFAALPAYWTNVMGYSGTNGYNLSKGKDWMLTTADNYPWTISSNFGNAFRAFYVASATDVVTSDSVDFSIGVRPTFALSSDAKITNATAEGVGSKDVPMIIS